MLSRFLGVSGGVVMVLGPEGLMLWDQSCGFLGAWELS